jgi:hypothetical protein
LEEVFCGHLDRTWKAARKLSSGNVSEVDWIERFHEGCASGLGDDLRRTLRERAGRMSVTVDSALVHGSPFQILPSWGLGGGIEIGDLMLVGQQFDKAGALLERQALLLQMKVGTPGLTEPPGRTDSTSRQGHFFATWPRFCWRFRPIRERIPQPPCRDTGGGPSDAAQFGLIWRGGDQARCLDRPGRFVRATPLAAQLARVVRLDLGVDATPTASTPPDFGWPRIVQDILDRSSDELFRGVRRGVPIEPAEGRSFATITVSTAPMGILD